MDMMSSVDKNAFFEELERIFALNSLDKYLTEESKEKFYLFTRIFLEVNKRMNLTSVTGLSDIILKHYADCVTVAKYIPKGARVIDVGCGPGFPLFPLAIVREDIQITALDSTAKKIEFVKKTAAAIGLDNIEVCCKRAEEAAHNPLLREKFDIACARAVARMEILCEYCIPYVKVTGSFIAMKARPTQEEIEGAERASRQINSKVEKIEKFTITDGNENYERMLILIKKQSPTPKNFPRNNAQISKKPL
ncbi:MAG: 16S rRNA (guanine(527)-N(7))-methyltransferase RsmG [Clostridiales bacterium]|nr:16S rRNA (guanine(527)-N(7))-methyltransferase RsmG [Clostridiales bacterium]